MAWWWSLWSKRRGKLQSSSCAGKYDTVSTGTNTTAAIITAEKKHGKFGRAADHHEALCLAMCKYEIIILLKMTHHLMSLFQANKCFHPGLQILVQSDDNYVTWHTNSFERIIWKRVEKLDLELLFYDASGAVIVVTGTGKKWLFYVRCVFSSGQKVREFNMTVRVYAAGLSVHLSLHKGL